MRSINNDVRFPVRLEVNLMNDLKKIIIDSNDRFVREKIIKLIKTTLNKFDNKEPILENFEINDKYISRKITYSLEIDEELFDRLSYMANVHARSINSEIVNMIRIEVYNFSKEREVCKI